MMSTKRTAGLALVSSVVGALLLIPAPLAAESPVETGQALFIEKQCVRCHRPRGEDGMGPPVEELRRAQGSMELAGRLWNHVPAMFASLGQAGVQWPTLSPQEMAALMAYLGADASRDPRANLSRGQQLVVRKGCLKCHSLKREGGKIQPDLAERRGDYESAAAWAATMWMHSPRMAAVAAEQGVPYPRFAGDEMGNLLAFLRQAAGLAPRPTRR